LNVAQSISTTRCPPVNRPTGPAWRRRGSRLRRAAAALTFGAVAAFVGLRVLDVWAPLAADCLAAPRPSAVVAAADGTPLHVGLDARGERRFAFLLADASPHLVHALVASEDRRFYEHRGVDVRSLGRAAWADVAAGRLAEGGSTLSMQLARLVAPTPRTIAGKALQLFRAWQLERIATKDEILERYLDLVPLTGNLRGAPAACAAWFAKSPRDLSADEAALLVSVIPAPTRFDPRKDPAGARIRRDRVLARMHDEGFLDDVAWRAAAARPVRLAPPAFPDVAPNAWSRAGAGPTSIDAGLQRIVENLAADAAQPDGVAVVVVDNETATVRALVGAREAEASAFDATAAPRSAGSTLKPFLYAMALDAGLVVPDTPLLDLPWTAPDWAPTDFDPGARGPVRAREAQATSLNLPAVRLAASLPRGAFAGVLHRLGLAHVREPADGPGVDLALGTDDATPLELAEACATLARGGVHRPLRITMPGEVLQQQGPGEHRVLSEGACALVTEALSGQDRARPDGASATGIAWKTGTSSRRRDAWAAGWTRRTTVVVWRGRLDGGSDDSLVGARAAVPLLFAVLVAADPSPAPLVVPAGAIASVEVCTESGLAPTASCRGRRTDRRPAGAAALASCTIHRRVDVDAATGALLCPRCRSSRATSAIVERDLALFPPAWAAWRAQAGLSTDVLPPHAADCPSPFEPDDARPVFVEPREGQRFAAGLSSKASVIVRVLGAAE
jgi:penicillin-binding protein 1C